MIGPVFVVDECVVGGGIEYVGDGQYFQLCGVDGEFPDSLGGEECGYGVDEVFFAVGGL